MIEKILVKASGPLVHPADMPEGAIGELVSWHPDKLIGEIVQKRNGCLILVGQPSIPILSGDLPKTLYNIDKLKVQIYEKGTLLMIK